MNKLRFLRTAAKKTKAETAFALGVSVDTITRMEKGLSKIGLEDISILADLFGCKETDFLLCRKSNPTPPRDQAETA